jgi:hypothetical protein
MRDRMTPCTADAFDREVRTLVLEYCGDKIVKLDVFADVIIGLPMV